MRLLSHSWRLLVTVVLNLHGRPPPINLAAARKIAPWLCGYMYGSVSLTWFARTTVAFGQCVYFYTVLRSVNTVTYVLVTLVNGGLLKMVITTVTTLL